MGDIEIKLTKDEKSAYELAVDNGFTGTRLEWLDFVSDSVQTPTMINITSAANSSIINNIQANNLDSKDNNTIYLVT